MNLLKRIVRIFSGRMINKVFRYIGLSLLVAFCFMTSIDVHAADLDPDAVWENIAAINERLDTIETDLGSLESDYDSIQQIIEAFNTESQTISQKLDLTNELLKYFITRYEVNYDAEIISKEEDLKVIVENSVLNTAAVTGAVSVNTDFLQIMNARQAEDISNKELMVTLSNHLIDVSGNTLELSNSAKNENGMIGLVVAACIIGIAAIAVFVIVKALSKSVISHVYKI